MASPFFQAWADWISDLNGPGSESSDSAKPTQQHDESLNDTGPESRCQRMSEPSMPNGVKATAWDSLNHAESELVPTLGQNTGMATGRAGVIAFNWQTGTDQLQPSSEVSPSLHKGQTPAVLVPTLGQNTGMATGRAGVITLFNPSRSKTGPGEFEERFKEDTIHDALTAQEPPKGRPIVLISFAEDSPAKTSQSPENAPASTVNDQDCSSRQPESLTLFSDPEGGSSLRTFPDFFPQTVDEISPSFSRRWPTSGFMTSPGECWTADTSECPSGGGVFSSLPDVLEATVPSRFFLSPKAAAGILRRARKRGRDLPEPLERALRERLEEETGATSSTATEPMSREAA